MQTRHLEFYSDGIRLEGLLQLPDHLPVDRLPVVLLCSGYQGLKELIPGKLWKPFIEAGYACLAFDYRGFGTSDGERGRVLPLEQAEDVRNAVTLLQQKPELNPAAIGALGWGLGGGVVVQAAADDPRIKVIACLNGVGDAGRAVSDSRTYYDWLITQDRIAEDSAQRVITGESQRVSPWDIVPLDPLTRDNVEEDMYGNHERFGIDQVSLQSAQAYYAFRPELVADRISPRPLLIVHGTRNTLHPIHEARSLYDRARDPKEIIEVIDAHHLDWIQPGTPQFVDTVPRIIEWFRTYLPVEAMHGQPTLGAL